MAEVEIGIAESEMLVAVTPPAVFSNRVLVSPMGTLARLAFLETMVLEDGTTAMFCRASVVLTASDLMTLRDVIDAVTKNVVMVPTPAGVQGDG